MRCGDDEHEEHCYAEGSFALFAVVVLFFGACTEEFVRPPPGRILLTPHNKPASHPQQIHISVVGDNRMRISWVTDDKHVPSLVEYGKVSGVYDMSATGEYTSYRYFLYASGKIHHVTIGPLEPDAVYYYRCGGVGDEFSFKTPPPALPIEFVVIGDLGQTEWTASTLSNIAKSPYNVLLLPGDLSYADGQQPLWDSFARLVSPLARSRPWMVATGNHDAESSLSPLSPADMQQQCSNLKAVMNCDPFLAYNARWRMPGEESGSHSNLFYSFHVAGGAIHVIVLGSYAEFGPGSAQYEWLVGDLERVDRGVTKWVVVVLHAPWYSTNLAHQGEGESMRRATEHVLYNARVDVLIAGHVHAYERFRRIYDNEPNPCGPVYITIGDGGNREGLAFDFQKDHKFALLSSFREASFGHGRLKVINETTAHWSWHRNEDSDSTVRDELWLESLSSSDACRVDVKSVSTASAHTEL
ncbi:Purple acid phosphatase 22 [Ananas comosus]|uniref:Purple acid phosphatase n=1 Tax=Ananas comosus TaxID=4615 RepID=A0A199UH13_ANACO|nr:Purple acid phosphatase 22 [Ananas comosus]